MPATRRFIVFTLLIALLAQVALYWPTLHQLPFGDDWGPPLSEINRGERVGALSFFLETRQPDSYRPMQSLLIWLFGRVGEPMCWPSIRVLHFLSSGVAFVVLGLLLRQWRFGRAGAVVAAAVAALHPALVAPVGSIDGFSSILSCAAVWWGVWMMTWARDRFWLGLALAVVALVVGTSVKEYAFAMTPTAVLAAWFLYRPRWRAAFITAVVMGALTVFLLWVRKYTKPTDMELPASDFDLDSLWVIVQNALLVPAGGFFLGDSLWLYVTRDAIAIAAALVVVALTFFALAGGLWERLRGPATDDSAPSFLNSPLWAVAFLILSIPAVTFPANTVMRMSEMYLCGLVFTVALLAALAADGWAADPSAIRRRGAAAIAVVLAASSTAAVWHKMNAMVALGVRTRIQVDTILAVAKELPDKSKIALLYRSDQVPPRATYSSFRLPDCYCVRPPAADCFPITKKLTLLCPESANEPDAPVHLFRDADAVANWDRSQADAVLYWDVPTARFIRLK